MTKVIELFDGIELLSGAYMDYKNPHLSEATIEDIGIALSNVCRFAGHLGRSVTVEKMDGSYERKVPRFYSVAQHVVNTAKVVEAIGGTEDEIFQALMHDTAEAFTNDLPTPLKAAFPVLKELEVKIEAAMANRFGFTYPYCDKVKFADLVLLGLEKKHVKKCDAEWACLAGIPYKDYRTDVDLSRMTSERAYEQFMEWYWRFA